MSHISSCRNFTIRPAAVSDAEAMLSIYAPFIENTCVTFETEVPSTDEFAERIMRTTANYPWLVCEGDGVVVGYAYASRHRERSAYRFSADLSVYVSPDVSRRGIGKSLCTEVISVLEKLGVCRLFSAVTVPNAPSFGLHSALGF